MFGPGYTPPDDEGPEARMAREIQQQHEADCAAVERLLAELKPWDAHRTLFTFEEIKNWNLRRRKKPV